jgi:hypothetical protein
MTGTMGPQRIGGSDKIAKNEYVGLILSPLLTQSAHLAASLTSSGSQLHAIIWNLSVPL